jgi:hypothetical protein
MGSQSIIKPQKRGREGRGRKGRLVDARGWRRGKWRVMLEHRIYSHT